MVVEEDDVKRVFAMVNKEREAEVPEKTDEGGADSERTYVVSSYSSGYIRSVNIISSETFATIENIELCKSHDDRPISSIKGCVDGVLLAHTTTLGFYNNEVNVIFLWNPTLRKVVDIPLYGSLRKKCCDAEFGFGFDSVSNIYKVVALYLEKNYLKIKVYNLGTRSWTSNKVKRSSIDNVKYTSNNTSRGVNFEGCVYWLAKAETTENKKTHYLCFNLSSEALTCSKLPDVKRDAPIKDVLRELSVLYDSLALVDTSVHTSYRDVIRVWIRRKNNTTNDVLFSWVELYNLDFHGRSFLYLTNNGKLYLQWPVFGVTTTLVYDLKTGKEKVCSKAQGDGINFMDSNLESLALLR
ncbi:uncharacterized protein LOC141651172 [Silene latifolia]|uniref:uncharacterized protein LOC141651172 n=1 Tax=Silene latifolia TaxID=37657 RepID=UPI003D77F186